MNQRIKTFISTAQFPQVLIISFSSYFFITLQRKMTMGNNQSLPNDIVALHTLERRAAASVEAAVQALAVVPATRSGVYASLSSISTSSW